MSASEGDFSGRSEPAFDWDDCVDCNGSGRDDDEWDERCIFCNGHGQREYPVCPGCDRFVCDCDCEDPREVGYP